MTRDFAVLGGISLTGRVVTALLERGLRPAAIVLGGDDFGDEFEGLAAPTGEPPAWWRHHQFLVGGWRVHLQDCARRADVPILRGPDPYALLPATSTLVVAGFSHRIPTAVTQRYGDWALNVHPSRLPQFGGPQPEVQAILHEQSEAGVSVHTITPEFDAGPLRAQRSFRVHEAHVVADLEAHAAALGAECIEALLSAEQLPLVARMGEPSYFKMLPESAADLARCRSLAEARKLLRLRPEVYAYFEHAGSTLYPLTADTVPCPFAGSAPALVLPDGTLHCHEWVARAPDGGLSHHQAKRAPTRRSSSLRRS